MIGLRFCDWLKVDLVKRSADGRNFFLPSYARTPKLKKELKWPRLNSIKSRDKNSGFRVSCIDAPNNKIYAVIISLLEFLFV